MQLLDSLNDFSWNLLEKLKLADFFEVRRIPPLLLPIILIALVLAVILLLSLPRGGVQATPCGDGVCDPSLDETITSCPADCAGPMARLKTVKVQIKGEVKDTIEVRLDDSNMQQIRSTKGKSNEFPFTGVSAEQVMVTVRNLKNNKVVQSDIITLVDDLTEIAINPPTGFFDSSNVPPSTAALRVIARDSTTDALVPAKATLVLVSGDSQSFGESKRLENGVGYFTVEANQWYAIVIDADGYDLYDTRANPIMLEPNSERDLIALLAPSVNVTPSLLRVCVEDQDGIPLAALAEVQSLTGEVLAETPLVDGCTSFELTAGILVVVSVWPEGNCSPSSREIAPPAGESELRMGVICGLIGQARLNVIDENGTTLTQGATITAWYSNGSQIIGSGMANSLAMGSDGYTEYTKVAATARFYFVVTNLPGYSAYTSRNYTLDQGENQSITITLHRPPPAEYDFTFSGISYPNPVKASAQFTVTISKVSYGVTDVTRLANVTISLAGQPCSTSRTNVWTAICTAPQQPGSYDLAIVAVYNGLTGSDVKGLTVLEQGAFGFFGLIQYPLTDTNPPMPLVFGITLNNTPLDSLSDSSLSVYYDDGGGILVQHGLKLTGTNGTYTVEVDTPYPGSHRASIYLMKIIGSKVYEQNFTTFFESEPSSVKVTASASVSPRILAPGEAYAVYMTINYGSDEVPDLTNVYFTINNQRAALVWDTEGHAYSGSFIAPSYEGIYTVKFELGYQKLIEQRLYVVDTTKSKTTDCPIANCQNIPEVRQCVYKHRSENFYSEDDTIDCIESGWMSGVDISHCMSSDRNRGDWSKTCKLDSTDTSVLTLFMRKIPDTEERKLYLGCGDMDNDGDVDDSDKTCLTNVIANKWFGDVGVAVSPLPETCPVTLSGGFCYDIGTSSSLKGDFDGNSDITQADVDVMTKILRDVSMGVRTPETLLNFTDFNWDGKLNGTDKNCLMSFMNISIQQMMANVQQGLPNYPGFNPDCLNIYNISCGGPQGDLTSDGVVSEMDLIILGLIAGNIGGIFTGASGQEFAWNQEFAVSTGQTISLSKPISYNGDWIAEMEGTFDFSDTGNVLFKDPGVEAEFGGKFALLTYTEGQLPGQTLLVSPSVLFSPASNIYGCLIDITSAYKGVPFNCFGMTLALSTAGTHKIRIEYYYTEHRIRVYWDNKLMGHYAVNESARWPGAFGWTVSQVTFPKSSGTFRYYVGDLDPYMTRYGSLECADFNEDGVIDETDFLCMSMFLTDRVSYLDSPYCESCTQRGLKEGWYFPQSDICGDGYDNDCDGAVDIVRAGTRTDVNWCNCEEGNLAWCICTGCARLDIDGGASPGIDDGNYAWCMKTSWAGTNYAGEAFDAFQARWVRQDAPDAMNRGCTQEYDCQFYMCYDNYEICAHGSDWRQMGGGSFHTPSNLDSMTPADQEAWTTMTEDYRGRAEMFGGDSTQYPAGQGASGDESSGAPTTTSDGDVSIDTDYTMSMDGTHYIGSSCGTSPATYYGPWGDFLECEGDDEDHQNITHCGDGWDNNCLSGDATCEGDDGDSCPFVYSYDGDDYHFDHEAYTFSNLPQKEATSYGVMENLKPSNGGLNLLLSEEMDETSYTNYMKLYKVSHPQGTSLMVDAEGNPHTIRSLKPPMKCAGRYGNDCLVTLANKDGNYWSYDLTNADSGTLDDMYDSILLEFPAPKSDFVKLVGMGKESQLLSFAWSQILELVGRDGLAQLVNPSIKDAEPLSQLDIFLERNGKMHFYVWDNGWKEQAARYLDSERWMDFVIPLKVKPGQPIKVKIENIKAGFWLDYLAMDYSTDEQVSLKELRLKKALQSGEDVTSRIAYNDGSYLTQVPGDEALITFSDSQGEGTYVIEIGGYFIYNVKSEEGDSDYGQTLMRLLTDWRFLAEFILSKYPD